jgi:hypothetical protein
MKKNCNNIRSTTGTICSRCCILTNICKYPDCISEIDKFNDLKLLCNKHTMIFDKIYKIYSYNCTYCNNILKYTDYSHNITCKQCNSYYTI